MSISRLLKNPEGSRYEHRGGRCKASRRRRCWRYRRGATTKQMPCAGPLRVLKQPASALRIIPLVVFAAFAGAASHTAEAARAGAAARAPQAPGWTTHDEATPPARQQEASPDLVITPIYHASLMLQFGDTVIQVDPWSRGDYQSLPMADVILITDVHGDHLDVEAASLLMGARTVVVAPSAVGDRWGGVDVVLANGEQTRVDEVLIEAVPMYNLERGPSEGELYHDPGRGNGYVLTLGGQRIYISGDTECTPQMRQLRDIDVAFVTMNLPYTMTPGEAAECVKAFKPKVVYPYHYRGSDLDVFQWRLEDTPEVEVRLVDWYPEPH